jgi:hypothetical protein
MSAIHIPWTIVPADALKPVEAPLPEPPPPPAPIDLGVLLTELDAELEKLDSLVSKEREFPGNITRIDGRLRELEGQDLSTLEALEARSAQAAKLVNMKHLAEVQAKKNSAAIQTQTKVVIEIGAAAARRLEVIWYELYAERATQIKAEFDRLFYHAFESQDLLASYKPLTLLKFLKFPDLVTSSLDLKITRFRQLRKAVDQLKAFETMTLEQVGERLEEIDRETRERRQQYRPPPGYPESEPSQVQRTVQLL